MRNEKNKVRWIAGLVLLSFSWIALGLATEMPLGATAGKTADKATAAQIDPAAAGATHVLEKAGAAATVVKKKRFPWLLAAAGMVGVGIAVYFLFIHTPKQVMDIRGKWRVTYHQGAFTMVAQFSGTLTAGTVSILEGSLAGDSGTYQVSGDQVSFDISVRYSYYVYKYQGQFDTADSISGTYIVEADYPSPPTPSDFTAVRME